MIKFIKKKHVEKSTGSGKIVIYYSVTDIFLGVMLMALVAFFIHDYLSHSMGLFRSNNSIVSYPMFDPIHKAPVQNYK